MATGFPTKANWAAGDVLTASAMDDLAGTVNLLSNASAASGSQLISNAAGTSFAYQATPSASNPVLNSAMAVIQRGASISLAASTAATYTLDRWQTQTGANQATTVARQATGDTTNLPNIQYALRFQRNSGQTGTSTYNLAQSFESINSVPFAGKTITYSFYARAGANYSATSSALTAIVVTGTGSDQNVVTGFTGAAYPISQAATLTTTWQRFSYTGTVAATATQLGLLFQFVPTGTAGTNDYYEVTGIQIDIGSVALPFRTYALTIQGELAACQRYYQRWTTSSGSLYCNLATGVSEGSANPDIYIYPPVAMRVTPTAVDFSTLRYNIAAGASQAVNALSISSQCTPNFIHLSGTAAGSIGSIGQMLTIQGNNSSSAYFGVSAEL